LTWEVLGVIKVLVNFVSLGEVMVQFNPLSTGPLRYPKLFEVHVAGSEANMLVGLTKLGYQTGLISRVGNDEFGFMIIKTLRGEGVDVSRVKIDPEAPTGIYFVQRHFPVPGQSTVLYYRHGSAASRMSPEDIDEDYLKKFNVIILTGITPALSDSCYQAVQKAYRAAEAYGLDTVFDTNIRIKLWKKPELAREKLKPFLKAKVVFTNREDLAVLYPGTSIEEAALRLIDVGAEIVVVKLGGEGALALTKNNEVYRSPAYRVPVVEDVVGAGDAFNAAFLATLYRGEGIENALKYGAVAGALVVTVRGDIEAQPTWKDLEAFVSYMEKKEQVHVR
jgi:sugar/nucleoside kinase (ribokinase family)